MPKSAIPASSQLRALVVEPDFELRRQLSAVLRDHGLEVMDCEDVVKGRELFANQRLVVAPLNGNNDAMKQFVAWVRAEAGVSQPWIIAMGVDHHLAPGETPAHYGVNDFLTGPVDTASLVSRLEELGLGRTNPLPATPVPASRPAPPSPPSYHRSRPGIAPAATSWDSASAPVLLEQFPAAVAILDRHMKYLAVNSRWVREFQIPGAPLAGRCHYDVFPDLHPDWRGLYDRCLAGDQKQCVDDLMFRADGSESLVHWEIQPWHETTGSVGGLVLTCASIEPPAAIPSPNTESDFVIDNEILPAPVDPTPLSKSDESAAAAETAAATAAAAAESAAAAAAAKSEAEPAPTATAPIPAAPHIPVAPPDDSFREMAEAAPFGMILLDDQAHVLYANPQHRAVLGFAASPQAPIQTWLERACAGDDVFQKRAMDEWWENVWRRRTPITCSLRNAENLVKDIEFRPAALSGDRLLLTIFDVTDARLDEQAVRTSEARYRGLFQ
ncbi:MAG: uncharacterized protein JWL81_1302, partial [Verrucomicrobiales bacterium]|nr:uncharacterized protein [Verrucomicrobiales bacterium]